MRYTVRLAIEKNITNVYLTNDISDAIQKEIELKEIHGKENVWIADSILEILVG